MSCFIVLLSANKFEFEHVTRKSGVSDVSDEDATRILARMSHVSSSWNLENDTTYGQTGSTTYYY